MMVVRSSGSNVQHRSSGTSSGGVPTLAVDWNIQVGVEDGTMGRKWMGNLRMIGIVMLVVFMSRVAVAQAQGDAPEPQRDTIEYVPTHVANPAPAPEKKFVALPPHWSFGGWWSMA